MFNIHQLRFDNSSLGNILPKDVIDLTSMYIQKTYTFGYNTKGSLGLGNNITTNSPTLVNTSDAHISSLSAGGWNSAIIINNKLYMFGDNQNGQLGLDHIKSTNIPTLITGPWNNDNVTHVSTGDSHTAVIANGKLYVFGNNEYGQLGLGHFQNINIPTLLIGPWNDNPVTFVAAGSRHTAVISNNKLYMFGCNDYGQLGITCVKYKSNYIKELQTLHAIQEGFFEIDDIDIDNEFPPCIIIPTLIDKLDNVTYVAAGYDHTAIISNNQLYTCGNNNYGQLGITSDNGDLSDTSDTSLYSDDSLSSDSDLENKDSAHDINLVDHIKYPVTFVSAGMYNTFIITNNQLYVCGRIGEDLIIKNPTDIQSLFPLTHTWNKVTYVSSMVGEHIAVIADNKLYMFGNNADGQLGLDDNNVVANQFNKVNLDNVIMACTGYEHTIVLTNG